MVNARLCDLVRVNKSLVARVNVHIPSMHVNAYFDIVFFCCCCKFSVKVCGSCNDIRGHGIITGCL